MLQCTLNWGMFRANGHRAHHGKKGLMRDRLSCVACVLLFIALMLVSLRYITDFWLLAFFYSLQPHIGAAAIIGSLICLAIRRSTVAWALLAWSMFITGHAFWMKFEFLPPSATVISEKATRFRLLSFNVLGDNFTNADRIVETIRMSGADVAYAMEAGPLGDRLDQLKDIYPYHIGCGAMVEFCDLLILSKYPIEQPRFFSLSELRANRFAIAGIRIGGQLVNFSAIHVTKPYFDDYHTLELIRAGAYMRQRPGPKILAGDFNSDSIAPDMQRFLRHYKMHTAGFEPATWPIEAGPFGVPIDHIFMTGDIKAVGLHRLPDNEGSNHFGLIADLAIEPAIN